MSKYPCLPLWTDAFLADTNHLSDCQVGLYLRLLLLMWRTPRCRVPNDLNWINKRLKGTFEELKLLVDQFCQRDGTWIIQKRLRVEYSRVAKLRQSHRRSAKSRWEKEKGLCVGNATKPIPKPIKKEEERKEVSIDRGPALRALPINWIPNIEDFEYAQRRGLSEKEVNDEAQRFVDHAIANNRRQADWHAAWRNWITSPYQQRKGNGNGRSNGRHETAVERGARLIRAAEDFESAKVAGRENQPDRSDWTSD